MTGPTIDHAFERIRLDEVGIAALRGLAAAGAGAPRSSLDDAWDALGLPELAHQRQLPGWVAEVGRVLAAPGLHLVVELAAGPALAVHQYWATPARAVVGSSADTGYVELATLDTAAIPFELGRLLALAPRPPARTSAPVTISTEAWAAAEEAAEAGDRSATVAVLADDGLGDEEVEALADLCCHRRLTWRVSSTWRPTPDDVVTASLVGLDGGDAGLWTLVPAEGAHTDDAVVLRPSRPSEVWHELLGLLPGHPAAGGTT